MAWPFTFWISLDQLYDDILSLYICLTLLIFRAASRTTGSKLDRIERLFKSLFEETPGRAPMLVLITIGPGFALALFITVIVGLFLPFDQPMSTSDHWLNAVLLGSLFGLFLTIVLVLGGPLTMWVAYLMVGIYGSLIDKKNHTPLLEVANKIWSETILISVPIVCFFALNAYPVLPVVG